MIQKPQPKAEEKQNPNSKLQELLQPEEVRRVLEVSLDQRVFEQWSPQQDAPQNLYRQLDIRELIRLCRTLSAIERKAVRALLEGTSKGVLAEALGISPTRLAALLKRAFAKLRAYGELRVRRQKALLEADIKEAYLESTRQRAYRPPTHCLKGKERCARTGQCPYASR